MVLAFLCLLALAPPATVQLGAPPPPPAASRLWWGDLDGDGLPDAVALAAYAPARILRNEGGGAFVDATERMGLAVVRGAALAWIADLDGDLQADLLLVVPQGESRLFLGVAGVLVEATEGSGLAGLAIAEARPLDLDTDGLLDLELVVDGAPRLLHNAGAARFRPIELALPEATTGARAADPAALEVADGAPADADTRGAAERRRGPGVAPASASPPVLGPVPTSSAGPPAGGIGPKAITCALSIEDLATGSCLQASSLPGIGLLYPLSDDLNVSATGNVGMGTTSPSHRLTVQGTAGDDVLRLIGTQGPFALGYGAHLNFGDGDFVHLWEYDDDRLEVKGDKEVLLSANSGAVNVAAQEMAVSALDQVRFITPTTSTTGRLGVGTSTPAWSVHVSADQGVARLDSNASSNGSVVELRNQTPSPNYLGAINFVNNLGQFRGQVAYHGLDELSFRTAGTDRMWIESDGDVRIGTPTPYAFPRKLYVVGASTFAGGQMSIFHDTPSTAAVYADNNGGGDGVFGSGDRYGVVGFGTALGSYGVFSQGDLGATGVKSFVQPHPSDPGLEVRFACLEGNESGTYFRGSTRLVGGLAVVEVPEDFRLVTEPEGLTVQLTKVGRGDVWLERYDLDAIVVAGEADLEVHYLVQGVRRGFRDFATIRPNQAFVPTERGVPYGAQLPTEQRRVLVGSGVLNPDFTPNEATAASRGWVLAEPER